MKDSKRSSRVPPPHVADRRQAKSSLPKDCLARVGSKPKISHSSAVRSKNHLAWYVALNTKHFDKRTSHIPQIKWKCPPKFALNTGWQVAAGEGSREAEAPSPLTSSIVEGDCPDDSQTPIIPIIPIEEMAAQMLVDTSAANTSIDAPTPASCLSVSTDPPLSQSNPSESRDQSVHGKSLPPMLQGLESGDLEIAAAVAATVAALMQTKDQIDPELLIKLLSDPQMIKKLMKENGFMSKPEDNPPTEPKAITCSSLPRLTPASVVDKLDNGGEEPASKAILSNSTPEQVNQPPILPETYKVASKVGGTLVESRPNLAPKAAKGPSHSPISISNGPTKKLPARTTQIARQQKVRPLMPSTLRPDEGTILRLVKKYGGLEPSPLNSPPSTLNLEAHKKLIHDYGDVARVKPMTPMAACASMPPPHSEEIQRKMENFLLPDHGWGKHFMRPSPSLLSMPPSPPVTNLLESHVRSTGNFHPAFASMTIPSREVDLGYHRSLIKQHGEITPSIYQTGKYLQGVEWPHERTTIEMDPKFQKPCTYFTTSMGCQNGYNCPFQHNVPEQWRATGAVEAPINRVDMAPVAKRMKLNDQFEKWR